MGAADRVKPARVVFDSLSEMRLLAQNPLRYRRQVLALKTFFATRNCTVMLLDDRSSSHDDLQLHSIAHGVISLDQYINAYGPERRRIRVIKMRGIPFRGGEHDCALVTGGLQVFPRLVTSQNRGKYDGGLVCAGSPELDQLLGGGLARGSNMLFTGPSGAGKTTTAIAAVRQALLRGEKAAYYLFDESLGTLLTRSRSLGLDIEPFLHDGTLVIESLDPAEVSPGEFSHMVRHAVEEEDAALVAIDSLNAYLQAMPGDKHLMLQMHEVLTYLNQRGVVTILILAQHGVLGEVRSDVDLSYLSDGILLFRFFEARGSLLKAVSVVKSRTSAHELTIREFRLTQEGIQVGEALVDFEGVMTGVATYRGGMALLADADGKTA
jgi:circadian clock protein KaiC